MEELNNENKIIALSGIEAVRRRPEMYFQKCYEEQSLDYLGLEMACHAIDEFIDGNCTKLEFTLKNNSLGLRYNAGMSLELTGEKSKAELIMSVLFACSNEKKHKAVGDEFCELGMATINFACEYCELETVKDGQRGNFVFKEGALTEKKIELTEENCAPYSTITMLPDKNLFGELSFTYEGLQAKTALLTAKYEGLAVEIT